MPIQILRRHAAALSLCAFAPLPALAQTTATIPTVEVVGERERDQVGPVRGWEATTSNSATRTDTPLVRIPQTIQVLPRQLLEDTGTRNLDEALRNAAGAQGTNPLYFNQNFFTRIRGFPAEIYRDGQSSFFDAGFGQLLMGIERVEVISGPTGSLFGGGYGGGLGGAVNLISRQPSAVNSAEAGIRFGSFGLVNPWVDVNRAVIDGSDQVLLRFQGEGLNSSAYVNRITQTGYNIQPAVTFRNNDTSLTIQGFFSRREATEYPGLPVQGTIVNSGFLFNRRFNVNGAAPQTVTERNGVAATLTQRISDGWEARLSMRYGASRLDEPTQLLFGYLGGSTFSRFNGLLRQDLTQITLMPTITGRFITGPVRHTVLAGFEYDQVSDRGLTAFAFSDLFDATRPTVAPYVRPAAGLTTDNNYRTLAGFVQEQATIWDRVHLLGALRVSSIRIDSRTQAGVGFTANTNHVNPRVGAAVDLGYGVTAFAGYGSGVRANPYVTLVSGTPKPEESEQVEAGIRVRFNDMVSASAAYFDITRRNVAVADAIVLFAQRQTGEQRSKGMDLNILVQPSRALSFHLNYAYIDATTTRDTVIRPGTALQYVPRQAGRAWATYRFVDAGPEWLQGLSLGGGVTFSSGAPVLQGGPRTQGFATLDAQIGYTYDRWRVSLTARNLADQRYFLPYEYLSGAVAPSTGREFFATVAARF